MVDGRYYRVQQASEIFGVDDETVLAWIHSGQLVAVDLSKDKGGKRPTWRIAEAELGRFLLSRRNMVPVKPEPPKPTTQTRKPRKYV